MGETLGYEGEYQLKCYAGPLTRPSLPGYSMPPRTTEKSYRPRVSDRTVVAVDSTTDRLLSFTNRRSKFRLQDELGRIR